MAVCLVPSAGPIPKLVVARDDGLAVRYDLRGLAKAPAMFADAADPSGVGVAAVTPVKVGETAPIGPFTFSLQSAAFPVEALDGGRRDEGRRYPITMLDVQYGVDKPVRCG